MPDEAGSAPLRSNQQPAAGEASSRPSTRLRVLYAVNESTKWTVSAAVAAVLVWLHNQPAAWCVVGTVVSSFVCKVLKHVINQQRPENARKSDPGMPSSHANSLNFLSVYAALALQHAPGQPATAALAASAIALGAFLTWLRVALGFHTWPQVLVGAALGAATASAWFLLGVQQVLPALEESPAGSAVLFAVTGAAMAAFAVNNVLFSWAKERQRQRKHDSGQLPPTQEAAAQDRRQQQEQQLELEGSTKPDGDDGAWAASERQHLLQPASMPA